MKIIVALDSFKGTMSAHEACGIVQQAIHRVDGNVQVEVRPMADGGEGTTRALVDVLQGTWITKEVRGPLMGQTVEARYGWLPGDIAMIEMAAASGLPLVPEDQRNPLVTTTFGTGELIRDAADRGAKRILLGVGGSATIDGGMGAAQALGWKFMDRAGNPVGEGGGSLQFIADIYPPDDNRLPPVEVLCDVSNPLCGERGAARVYGPQKGATPDMVETLDEGLAHLAKEVREQVGAYMKNVPGAGAAGGLAGGAIAFMDASLVPGSETVAALYDLENEMQDADYVITGEGKFDDQSMQGKVVSGVVGAAKESSTKVIVLAGAVFVSPKVYEAFGVTKAFATADDEQSLPWNLEHARERLALTAEDVARKLLSA